jgi:hypothetical protein
MKITQEMVNEFKNNRIGWDMLTPIEQGCYRYIGSENFLYRCNSQWHEGNSGFGGDSIVYRLRPDYELPKPEPELVKYEIEPRIHNDMMSLFFSFTSNHIINIIDCLYLLNFSHFEKENGNKIGIENIATEIRNGGKVFVVMVK